MKTPITEKTVSVTVTLRCKQVEERQHRGEQAADKLDQPGADQVAHAFHVGHDARDERAGAVLVVVGHREQAHVALHLAAHLGDQALAGFGKQLRERERSDGLHDHGARNDPADDAAAEVQGADASGKAPCRAAASR